MIISIMDKEYEYFFSDNNIEWRDGLKTKTQNNVSSFIINYEIVVTSFMKIKYTCIKCGKEMTSLFHNFKNRKTSYCISCIRRENAGKMHKNRTEEERLKINKKISQKTKEAMSQFTEEKKKEINDRKIKAINWEKRNESWLKTMSSKFKKEKNEIRIKVEESWMKKYGVEHISQKEYESVFGILTYQTKPELDFVKFCETQDIFIKDGPSIDYDLVDFETENYLIEIKFSHIWYFEDLKSGKIKVKNRAANLFAAHNKKKFLFLLNVKDYSIFKLHQTQLRKQ